MTEYKERNYLPPYDLLYEGIDLKEALGNRGVRLLIPRIYIFGRQLPNEYETKKRRQVMAALDRDKMNFLLENPIILCAVPVGSQLMLAIIDGHHRNRYSGLYPEIARMPCITSAPEVIVEIINSNKPEDKKIDLETFIQTLFRDTAEVIQKLPQEKEPRMIPDVSNIDDLKTRFGNF